MRTSMALVKKGVIICRLMSALAAALIASIALMLIGICSFNAMKLPF